MKKPISVHPEMSTPQSSVTFETVHELALRGLLGEGAPLSASSIERLRAKWQVEFEAWKSRPLDGRDLVYAWADGVYVKAGLEKEKAALLVVIGAMADGCAGAWAAAREIWPEAREQRCWNHKTMNVFDALPKGVAGQSWRRLNAPELLRLVLAGQVFTDGIAAGHPH
ncbi:MAG: transposase [Candidatus Sumerlaeia bacterium]|nr:transposase [Candidatus Sumerlaeia bacterium]